MNEPVYSCEMALPVQQMSQVMFCYRQQSLEGQRQPSSDLPQIDRYIRTVFCRYFSYFSYFQFTRKKMIENFSLNYFIQTFFILVFGIGMGFFSLCSANSARLGACSILTVLYACKINFPCVYTDFQSICSIKDKGISYPWTWLPFESFFP